MALRGRRGIFVEDALVTSLRDEKDYDRILLLLNLQPGCVYLMHWMFLTQKA